MQVLGKLFDFYVKASIHVALAVVAFTCLTFLFLNIPIDRHLLFFIFFSTIPTYNLIKHLTERPLRFFGLLSMRRATFTLSLVSLVIAGYIVPGLRWETLLTVLCLSLFTALYALPVFPRRKNLRHVGILKILIIGAVWSGTTVLLPVMEMTLWNSWDVWVEFFQRFLVVLVLMTPFEIRDLGSDPSDMLTIPQRLGSVKTKRAGLWVCLLFFLLTFAKDQLMEMEIMGKGIMGLSLAGLLIFMPQKQPPYFASFWVEAFPIFWAFCLWGLTSFI